MAQRRSQEIDQLIRSSVERGAAQDDLKQQIKEMVDPTADKIVDRQVESYLLTAATEMQEVEDVIFAYPPILPRGAKRMLNHARLVTRIARERKVFGGTPAVTPTHLGKWIVLTERWPLTTRRILENPQLMPELERQTRQGGLEHALEALALPGDPSAELEQLLRSSPPLGAVVRRLAYLEPALDASHVSDAGISRPPAAGEPSDDG